VSDVRKTHPLLRHVSLADLNIAEARRLTLAPGDEAVASALGAPLILTRVRPNLRIVALAFDVGRSDLPMRASFPLLLANAIGWLGAREVTEVSSLRTGRTLRFTLPSERVQAAVTDPDGRTQVVAAQAGAIEIPIARAGFYRIAPSLTLAANLADPIESDTTPAATLELGGRSLPPPDAPARRPRRELWWLALVAAAALSLGEWWTYHRRWTV
jgi:Ca-activated chloride channel family protein